MYSQQAAEGCRNWTSCRAEGEGAGSEPKQAEDAETVDADFEVVDEDKK